ncbi:hypothetical protein ZEAMMB73_Zm00001d041867 [Zea mays]|uniref:Uncharacterized protein n=1 Tax=Zea mays TaxID=4577 RepID=A0A1D6LK62_MAIZE|nr:hypothetical protein ZEAMMB73_Zm00001d014479 [Zea mays]AQK80103.1 hypothetical protein ZEAMMB73_Zm00001d035995 [Zea mays]ONM32078.1 hypothetical protein ZEAMMB73_Zm00001d040816 [Zea mays]ONM33875.1 hypothetical protein ZEAMMB73_Zm00001d041867 [Zea mays]
MKPLGYDV